MPKADGKLVSSSSGGRSLPAETKRYGVIFDAVMRLRRLCNNATYRRLT